jgi:uncharacterized protein
MPRPRKTRILAQAPRAAVYKPAGVPLNQLRKVVLFQEELEALRLADLKGLTQAQAAAHMGISRSTFQRILAQARHRVTQALVQGHALRIEGGTFEVRPARSRRSRHREP